MKYLKHLLCRHIWKDDYIPYKTIGPHIVSWQKVQRCVKCGKVDWNYNDIPKPTTIITNADHIRSMTNEELAELFEMIPHLGNPSIYTTDGFCINDGLRTKKQWLEWLNKEL